MKKYWKISLIAAVMISMAGTAFAQGYVVDTLRLKRAQNELFELESMDKKALTKAEKRAWKREKRLQKQIIAQEMDKMRFNREMENSWRLAYGSPYFRGAYGFANPAFFRPYPYGGFVRRPAVVVRPQNCVVPSRTRSRARN